MSPWIRWLSWSLATVLPARGAVVGNEQKIHVMVLSKTLATIYACQMTFHKILTNQSGNFRQLLRVTLSNPLIHSFSGSFAIELLHD